MLKMTHFAFFVETTLLNRHFAVVIVAVQVVGVPAKLIEFLSMVILVL